MKSIDIFYKSYSKDFKLLYYSLQSLLKNVEGFENIHIVIPKNDFNQFIEEIFYTIDYPHITFHCVDEYGSGYLFQQVCKVKAHEYSKADFILFADSDIIFDHPINLNDYIKNNTPEILYTPYDKVGDAICWKQPTERFLAQPIEFEFMRRNALIYHRSTLLNIAKQYPYIEEQIMASSRFSEFNFIGAWAFINEPQKYKFTNTDNWEYTPPLGEQLWSWANKDGDELHQKEYQRALNTINKTLNLNLTEL